MVQVRVWKALMGTTAFLFALSAMSTIIRNLLAI
jgi:hypothetical protein